MRLLFLVGGRQLCPSPSPLTRTTDQPGFFPTFQFVMWLKLEITLFDYYFSLSYAILKIASAVLFWQSQAAENVLYDNLDANVTTLGDFNIHNAEWWKPSSERIVLHSPIETFISTQQGWSAFPCVFPVVMVTTNIPWTFSLYLRYPLTLTIFTSTWCIRSRIYYSFLHPSPRPIVW